MCYKLSLLSVKACFNRVCVEFINVSIIQVSERRDSMNTSTVVYLDGMSDQYVNLIDANVVRFTRDPRTPIWLPAQQHLVNHESHVRVSELSVGD